MGRRQHQLPLREAPDAAQVDPKRGWYRESLRRLVGLAWNAHQSSSPGALGNPGSVGVKAFVLAWFRDPPAVKSTNLSNAVELTYAP